MFLIMIICVRTVDCFHLEDDQDMVKDVGGCLLHITEREFELNPLGFMTVPKTINLTKPADKVLNNYLQFIFDIQQTTVMTVGDDNEDIQWSKRGGINDQQLQDASLENDVATTEEEDEIIQSHLRFMRLSEFYVIIIDSFRLYNSKIRQIASKPSWNATARVVIYCSTLRKTRKEMMKYPESILRSLWMYHVMNVVILVHDYKNHSVLNIFSWEPYDPPARCGEKHQSIRKHVKLYNTCEKGRLAQDAALFPLKIPENLKGCPIGILGVIWHPFLNHNTSTGEDPGIDREILDIIAERINFTIELDTSQGTWGNRAPNGTWSGMMGALKRGQAEVGIGAIYPEIEIHEDFDSTMSYLQDSYVWIVPRAMRIPEWKNLVVILKPKMWLTTLVVFWICTVVWYLLVKSSFETGLKNKDYALALMDSYCLQLCISTVGRPTGHSMQIYFMAFCLYSMVWCTVYQTKLITILTNPIYEHQITQTNELLESDLKFGGNGAFRYLFNNSIDAVEDHFHENYLELDINEVLEHVIWNRNVSVLTSKLYVQYLSATTTHYNDKQGAPMFYILHANVFSFPVEMVSVKGFAFLERFNFIITLLKSSGLVRHIYNKFNVLSKRKAAKLARESGIQDMDENQALTLVHLQGAFIVLLLGISAATITFVGELVTFKRSRGKMKSIISRARSGAPDQHYTRYNFIKWAQWSDDLKNFDRLKFYKK